MLSVFVPHKDNPMFSTIAAIICAVKAFCYVFFTDSSMAKMGIMKKDQGEDPRMKWTIQMFGMFYFMMYLMHLQPGYDKVKAILWSSSSLFMGYYFIFTEKFLVGDPDIIKSQLLIAVLIAAGFWSRCREVLTLENQISSASTMNFVMFMFFPAFACSLYFPDVKMDERLQLYAMNFGIFNFVIGRFSAQDGHNKVKAIFHTAFGCLFAYYCFIMPSAANQIKLNTALITPWVFANLFWGHCYWTRCGGVDNDTILSYILLGNFFLHTFKTCSSKAIYFPNYKDNAPNEKSRLCWSIKMFGLFNLALHFLVKSGGYDRVKFIFFAASTILSFKYRFTADGVHALKEVGANSDMTLFLCIVSAYFTKHFYGRVSAPQKNELSHVFMVCFVLGMIANQAL